MNDLISREAMMVAMAGLEVFFPGGCDEGCYVRRGDAINAINSLSGVIKKPDRNKAEEQLERIGDELHQINLYIRLGYLGR